MHWQPTSWQDKLCAQAIPYPSLAEVQQVIQEISLLPALIEVQEIVQLQSQLVLAAEGKAFILQGGDCAERFANASQANHVSNTLNLLSTVADRLRHGLQKPIIGIGRLAGQYAKPRTHEYEVQQGISLPAYRGDMINAVEFSAAARIPKPRLMLQAYQCAKHTLQCLQEFKSIVNEMFYSSHEALLLPYEQALTRCIDGAWYNLSTHFPWLGMRTAAIEGAHVEYLRGIANPIAIKIGPWLSSQALLALLTQLNPQRLPGRITLIHRLGNKKINDTLPGLIEAIQQHHQPVLWMCDPMHGNTQLTQKGFKTRYIDEILAEVKQAFTIHRRLNSCLSGIHLEFTSEDVNECLHSTMAQANGSDKVLIDPRLNAQQALNLASEISHY